MKRSNWREGGGEEGGREGGRERERERERAYNYTCMRENHTMYVCVHYKMCNCMQNNAHTRKIYQHDDIHVYL